MKSVVISFILIVVILASIQPLVTTAQTGLVEAHAVKLRKSANQTLAAGVATPVTWDISVYDTDGFAISPTTLQVPSNLPKGIYAFDLVLEFAKTGTTNAAILIEVYNDDFVNQNYVYTLRDNSQTWTGSFAIRSDTGQTIHVVVTQRGGSNVQIVGSGIIQKSQINLTWIGTIE